jgi:hypothetical protein
MSAQPHFHDCDALKNIWSIAVISVLETAQISLDSKYCVGNLLHLLVVGAKEQARVFTEAKFRQCQSIKWTVMPQSQPCRAR